MKNITIVTIVLICCVFAFANATNEPIKGLEYLPKFLPYNVTGRKYCPTEDVWKWKKAMRNNGIIDENVLAGCREEGKCDAVSEREKYAKSQINIQLFVTVACDSVSPSRKCPSNVNEATIASQLTQINEDFKGTGITFSIYKTQFVQSNYATISAYGPSPKWYDDIESVKKSFAFSPSKYLNVFVTGQKSGSYGTLLGIGTFPWDNEAKSSTGGLWMNAAYVGKGEKTASHEIGHCVGLWHTFHGSEEVSCSSSCHEDVHPLGASAANTEGDFCSDTPAQPMNYACSIPSGSSCKGNAWTKYGTPASLYDNIMAYTPDTCMRGFTEQQSLRAKCWTCNSVSGWASGC